MVHVGPHDHGARHYSFDPDAKVELEEFTDVIGRNFRQPEQGLGFDNSPVAHMWRAMIRPASICEHPYPLHPAGERGHDEPKREILERDRLTSESIAHSKNGPMNCDRFD